MKTWIGFLTALILALTVTTGYARKPVELLEPKKIENKEAQKEFNEGVKAFKKEKYEEAVMRFQAAEKADPNMPEIHINLALAFAHQGKKEEAKKQFDQALTLISPGAAPG